MSLKKSDKSKIHNILVITLSNLGDVILTFPVIDILKRDFPESRLSVVVGPKAEVLFKENPYIYRTYIFDKAQSGPQKFFWMLELRRQKFDLVVDLRNSAIPFFIQAKYSTPLQIFKPKTTHMKTKHLNRLKSVFKFETESQIHRALFRNENDILYVDNLVKNRIGIGKKIFVVAPGAANHIKRWTKEGFGRVCDHLARLPNSKIVLAGDSNDKAIADEVSLTRGDFLNLCGETTITQLAELLRRSTLALTNDSAVMHLASYLDIPVVAIFGPTDPRKYGPWSSRAAVVRKDIFCSPCEKPGCAYQHECMKNIQPEEVFNAVQRLLRT